MDQKSKFPDRILCSFSDEDFNKINKLADDKSIGLATAVRIMIRDYVKQEKK